MNSLRNNRFSPGEDIEYLEYYISLLIEDKGHPSSPFLIPYEECPLGKEIFDGSLDGDNPPPVQPFMQVGGYEVTFTSKGMSVAFNADLSIAISAKDSLSMVTVQSPQETANLAKIVPGGVLAFSEENNDRLALTVCSEIEENESLEYLINGELRKSNISHIHFRTELSEARIYHIIGPKGEQTVVDSLVNGDVYSTSKVFKYVFYGNKMHKFPIFEEGTILPTAAMRERAQIRGKFRPKLKDPKPADTSYSREVVSLLAKTASIPTIGVPINNIYRYLKDRVNAIQEAINKHAEAIIIEATTEAFNLLPPPPRTVEEAFDIIANNSSFSASSPIFNRGRYRNKEGMGLRLVFADENIIALVNALLKNKSKKSLKFDNGYNDIDEFLYEDGPRVTYPIDSLSQPLNRAMFKAIRRYLIAEDVRVMLRYSFVTDDALNEKTAIW